MKISIGHHKQSGAVLVITLIFLTVLTIAVLSSSSSTLIQEKMTAATKDYNIALEKAEFALREAEKLIDASTSLIELEANAQGFYKLGETADPFDKATWNTKINQATNGTPFIIEELGTIFIEDDLGQNFVQVGDSSQEVISIPRTGFRVIARGTVEAGTQIQAQRILVSYYAKRF